MLFLWIALIAGAAVAGEERETRIEIVVEAVRFIDSGEIRIDAYKEPLRVRIIEQETTVTN